MQRILTSRVQLVASGFIATLLVDKVESPWLLCAALVAVAAAHYWYSVRHAQ